ncbi:GGDEF domain-containing protein [Roseateles oligotrophus]|uniref:diguanylate cyclase n=1 Tax=Roseateles oligotrophus TaxID=1769250 RepID=A0ABT2YEY7_9BURK|nr:GGDEF domain-containing protein [Roseateles oligotrophus]MCV2368597.1 GGDEF domain-containing protein [Roseateles oligotrophus]
MNLDQATLYLVVTVVGLLMAFWVCFMAWGQPLGHALWAWALALLAYTASHVFFGLQDFLPPQVFLIGGSTAYAVALVLMLQAVRRFQGVAQNGRWYLAPLLLVPLLYALLAQYSTVRVVCSSLIYAWQIGLILAALLDPSQPRHGRGRYILLGAFGTLLLTLLARAALALLGLLDTQTLAASGRGLGPVFLISLCAVLSITLGFVYMTMERAEQRNFELAMKDMLTGLANRRAIGDQLLMTVARAQRQGQYLSVLMLDVDHFKRVNDNFGHQAGDVVLSSVAQTLQSRLRAQDQIGRFGGEEFLAILPDTSLEGAQVLAEALRAAVEATPIQWGVHSIAITISIGVRGGAITGADTADGLVAAADAALYRAKQGGRNRVEVAQAAASAGPDLPPSTERISKA